MCGFVTNGPFLEVKNDEMKIHQKICDEYRKYRSRVNKVNSKDSYKKWAKGKTYKEIKERRKRVGEVTRKRILSSEKERNIRRQNMIKYNKSYIGRKKASETAKKTSKRPEIVQQRSKQLRRWREENPEKFEQLILVRGTSKSEQELFKQVKSIDESFEHGKLLYNKMFTSPSKKRQIDVVCKDKKIAIEFDGPLHFKKHNYHKECEKRIARDKEVNCILQRENWIIIRVSFDQFSYSKLNYGFSQSLINEIKSIILSKKPGLYKFGKAYEEIVKEELNVVEITDS